MNVRQSTSQKEEILIEGEAWKDVPGFEGRYQASTLGRIRSLPRMRDSHLGPKTIQIKGGVLKQSNTGRYFMVCLGGGGEYHLVHRLIALTFIPQDSERPHVNHKDGNTFNNQVENLEWVTPLGNSHHGRQSVPIMRIAPNNRITIHPSICSVIRELRSEGIAVSAAAVFRRSKAGMPTLAGNKFKRLTKEEYWIQNKK